MKKQTFLMLLAMMLLAACGVKKNIDITPEQLEGRWVLQTVEGVKLPATDTDEKPSMTYTMTDNRFACFVGCNRMGGSLHFENGALSLSNIYSTKMLCHNEEAMKLETRLGTLLDQVSSVSMNGNTLVLTSADGKELLTMVRE